MKNKLFILFIVLLGLTVYRVSAAGTISSSSIKYENDTYENVEAAVDNLYSTNLTNNIKKTLIWTGTIDPNTKGTTQYETIDIKSSYANYQSLTSGLIAVEQTDIATTATSFGGCSTSYSYTPSTGIINLTLTARKGFSSCGKQSYNVYVYSIGN